MGSRLIVDGRVAVESARSHREQLDLGRDRRRWARERAEEAAAAERVELAAGRAAAGRWARLRRWAWRALVWLRFALLRAGL